MAKPVVEELIISMIFILQVGSGRTNKVVAFGLGGRAFQSAHRLTTSPPDRPRFFSWKRMHAIV